MEVCWSKDVCNRFEEPTGGGGQLAYWFEKNLLAYLREGDLIRVRNEDLLHSDLNDNPFSLKILNQIDNAPGTAWLGLSWKNYLLRFASLEQELQEKKQINRLLSNAEKNWSYLDDEGILMEEIRNNGEWIRLWRIAINDFERYLKI